MTQFDATSQDRVLQSQLTCIFTSQLEALCLIPMQFRNHKISVYYVNIACKITTSLTFLSLSIFYEIWTQFVFCCVLSQLSNGWCQVNVSWSLHHRWCNRIMGNESQSQWHNVEWYVYVHQVNYLNCQYRFKKTKAIKQCAHLMG